ncbi:TPA: YadA C-terminal domain-containing protein [Enterobacter kobei]
MNPNYRGFSFLSGAGVGGFQGSQAVAVGATYNFNERVALKAGVSTSREGANKSPNAKKRLCK